MFFFFFFNTGWGVESTTSSAAPCFMRRWLLQGCSQIKYMLYWTMNIFLSPHRQSGGNIASFVPNLFICFRDGVAGKDQEPLTLPPGTQLCVFISYIYIQGGHGPTAFVQENFLFETVEVTALFGRCTAALVRVDTECTGQDCNHICSFLSAQPHYDSCLGSKTSPKNSEWTQWSDQPLAFQLLSPCFI